MMDTILCGAVLSDWNVSVLRFGPPGVTQWWRLCGLQIMRAGWARSDVTKAGQRRCPGKREH